MNSQELDALVAVSVMGWTRPLETNEVLIRRDGTAEWLPPWGGFAPGIQGISVIPNYSADIADAWLVVERMRERGFRFMLADDVAGALRAAYFIGSGRAYTAYAGNDADLICRAALRAVGVEVPE